VRDLIDTMKTHTVTLERLEKGNTRMMKGLMFRKTMMMKIGRSYSTSHRISTSP
jgi:hypothetical protein